MCDHTKVSVQKSSLIIKYKLGQSHEVDQPLLSRLTLQFAPLMAMGLQRTTQESGHPKPVHLTWQFYLFSSFGKYTLSFFK